MKEISNVRGFEQVMMPHLKAAYNLARYLTGNDDDASDIVQDSCLKALRFFDGFHGDNARAWLLTIVRNTFYSDLRTKKKRGTEFEFNEEFHAAAGDSENPETIIIKEENLKLMKEKLEKLPLEFREVIILRELEGFSYKEIAGIINIPAGTVMSRLSRGRKLLLNMLADNKSIGI